MAEENWKKVTDRYFSEEEKAHWAERMPAAPGDFDQEAYSRQWSELSARIEAALPLDPASAEAQAFLDEWQTLLEPFTRGGDARDDGRRDQPLQPHGRVAGRPEAAILDGGVALHSGSGKGARRLIQRNRKQARAEQQE